MNFSKLLTNTVLATVFAGSLTGCVTLDGGTGKITGNVALDQKGKVTGKVGADLQFKISTGQKGVSKPSVDKVTGNVTGNINLDEKGDATGEAGVTIQFGVKPQAEDQTQGAAKTAPTVKPKANKNNISSIEGPLWYEEAKTYLGTKEKKGEGKSNSLIEKMHNLTKNAFGHSDATAWCASFTNYVLRTTTEKYNLHKSYAGTGSSGARHFQDPKDYDASKYDKRYGGWGANVAVDNLHVGDIMSIIWNGGKKGHVGFVAGTYTDNAGKVIGIWLLGGNQKIQSGKTEGVNVALYMLDEAKRIKFKRPVGYTPNPAYKAVSYTEKQAAQKFGTNIGKRGSVKTSR